MRIALTAGGRVGLSMAGLMLFVAVFAPLIAPHDVGTIVTPDVFAPFSAKLPFGSDFLGRDMLSRILYGTRLTVLLALAAVLLAAVTGTTLGLLATVSGRAVDETMSRLLDALTSIPSKMFALMFVAAFGSSLPLLVLTAAVSYMPGPYRIARALAVNISTLEFVQVAKARGESALYIACVEMLPNMIHPMLADTGLRFTFVVLLLSGLSFLGRRAAAVCGPRLARAREHREPRRRLGRRDHARGRDRDPDGGRQPVDRRFAASRPPQGAAGAAGGH